MAYEIDNIVKGIPEKGFDVFRASLYLNRAMAKSQTKSCREAIDDSTYAMKLNNEPQFHQYCMEMRANCFMHEGKYKEAVSDYKALWMDAMQGQDSQKTAELKGKVRNAEEAMQLSKYAKSEKNSEIVKSTIESYEEIGTLTIDLFL